MLGYFFDSLALLFMPSNVLILVFGVFGGLIVGAIPGLTSTMAVALLVPVTYGMIPEKGLIMLVAVYVGAISGGLVSACLLKIPGTPSSVATTFDAFPMARRGEAGRALSIGVFASFVGGMISFFALLLLAPILGRFALRFSAFEYFSLVIFTLTTIVALSRKSLLKGLLSGCIGLLLGLVGSSATDGISRFTFGLLDLEAGFSVLPVLIGMYAITQVLEDISDIKKPFSILEVNFKASQFLKHVVSTSGSVKNYVRSAVIGIIIGILPGVGPGLSNVVAYSSAKASSEKPEDFGKGHPDGIIASEVANNASTGGALIPLLTLGIPGDATTMMMLGAFMIHRIQPGPLLIRDQGDLVMHIIVAFGVCNLIMLILMIFSIRVLIRSLLVPRYILYPVIMTLCVIGSYALNSSMFDVWVFLALGLFGVFLTYLKFPLLPLVLGLILGPMAENQLRVGLATSHFSIVPFFIRPISLVLILAAVFSVLYSFLKERDIDFFSKLRAKE